MLKNVGNGFPCSSRLGKVTANGAPSQHEAYLVVVIHGARDATSQPRRGRGGGRHGGGCRGGRARGRGGVVKVRGGHGRRVRRAVGRCRRGRVVVVRRGRCGRRRMQVIRPEGGGDIDDYFVVLVKHDGNGLMDLRREAN